MSGSAEQTEGGDANKTRESHNKAIGVENKRGCLLVVYMVGGVKRGASINLAGDEYS